MKITRYHDIHQNNINRVVYFISAPADQKQYNITINQYIKAMYDEGFGYGIVSMSEMLYFVVIVHIK